MPSRSILLIEDDTGIRESVAECLESEGYAVAPVSNGEEGLDWLRRKPRPDLIVLGLVMPVMNGSQFLVALRGDAGLKDIPVVLMTAAMPSTGMPIPQADAYLPKPFELMDLLDAVERYSAAR
jgi:two-component system, chemotaxis family, chemotaxis protein CheY